MTDTQRLRELLEPILSYIQRIDSEPGALINFPDERWVVFGRTVDGFTFGDLRAIQIELEGKND